MADKLRFVNDLRAAVAEMQKSYQKVVAVRGLIAATGWTPADFAEILPEGGEVTVAEFFDALASIDMISQGFVTERAKIAKLLP